MTTRRTLLIGLGGAVIATPFTGFAQPQPPRIAFLVSGTANNSAAYVNAVKQGLSENGLIEGRNYVLDVRWAEGHYERFTALAGEVVQRNPKVILVTTIPAALAAQRANGAIPLVMTGLNDPVKAGLIASLARPAGNITGVANMTTDLTPKLLEIVHAAMPKATHIAALFNSANPTHSELLATASAIAQSMNMTIRPVQLSGPEELKSTLDTIVQSHPDALMVMPDAMLNELREEIARSALGHRLAVVSYIPELTEAGALIGYGSSRMWQYHRAAYYVKRILDGARPATLPVEQPTRIELSINMRTAKRLGITIPQSILMRADKVIE